MNVETRLTCPLGSNCEKIVDNVLERCAWFITLQGDSPQDGKEVSESKCAMAWQPILIIEGNRESMRTNQSIQSLRNETVKRQNLALEVVKNARITQDR